MRTSTLVGLFLLPVVLFAAVPHVELPTNISPDPHGIAAPAEKPAAIYRLPVLKPSLVLMPEQLTVQAEDFIDWSVVSVGAPAAWAKGLTGKGVKVAVGDSGIDTGHKDFAGAIKASKDFTRNRNGVEDGNGHGCVMGSDMLYTTATGLSSAESVFAALIGPRIPDDIAVIKDVRHLEVYTLSANPKTGEPVRARVNAVHKLWHTGTMYKVKTGEGSLTLTPWHPIYVVTSTRGTERTIIKKRADEIQPGDNILLSGEIIEGDIKAKPRVSSAVVSIETFQHDDFVYDLTVEGTHVYACNGHIVSNTHCAGSIGARKNGWGVQGVAYECDLLVGKILSDGGSGRTDDISEFVTWAVSQGADVISLSIGGGGVDQWMPPVMAAAEQAGVLLICAAGNDGNGRPVNYPAAYKEAVAISAIDEQKRLAGFSCTGRQIACTGPGVKVRSCYPGVGDGLFADLSGTSMATPNIAGVAALWCQADAGTKKTRPARFRKWLEGSKDLGAVGRDDSFGWGLPDAGSLGTPATPVPPTPPTPAPDAFVLDESDLNDKGLRKLGGRKFRLEIGLGQAAPGVPEATMERLTKEWFEKGRFPIVFVGKENVDLVKWPDGVLLTDPPDQIGPGVWKTAKEESWGFEKLK